MLPDQWALQSRLGDKIAEPHRDQCRHHIGHRGAVSGDGAVVPFRIADPARKRAADEHLPCAKQQRRAEADKGQPEMSQDQSRITDTGQPPLVSRHPRERRLVDDLDLAPHPLVAGAAEFVARHMPLAGRIEAGGENRDVTRHQHEIDVRLFDQKAMHDIGAGGAERDRDTGRHDDTGRGERVLLADRPHGDRSVRFERAAEIALDEFPSQMQRAWVGGLNAGLRQ